MAEGDQGFGGKCGAKATALLADGQRVNARAEASNVVKFAREKRNDTSS
jgi:hypothetical protein